jgi:hypothetical protein
MKDGQLFRVKVIQTEADLPKKYGHYNTSVGKIPFGGKKTYNLFTRRGGVRIDWYLEPIEEQEQITDADIEAWAEENKKYMTSMGSAIIGAKAYRDGEIKHIEK